MSLVLSGLDGSNPLAFLAALGTHRLLSERWPGRRVRMRWVERNGWRPELLNAEVEDAGEVCRVLQEEARWAPLELFARLGNDLTVSEALFGEVAREVAGNAFANERTGVDFVAAFGSDIFGEKDRMEYTDLCFITGSGHQHFLGTARGLAQATTAEHLREALFGEWRYADPKLSFRWDPEDAREYALRWKNPSSEGALTMWGANRLAFEGLPLLATMPTGDGQTTASFRRHRRVDEMTWPIWTRAASVDTVRSLLWSPDLQAEPLPRETLRARGVMEVFRVQKVRIGSGANFKVSFRPARSV